MHEIHAETFRREAVECGQKAEEVARWGKRAWLKLAEDWDKLARGEDLYQKSQRLRTSYRYGALAVPL
jgi:hypothetical protein